MQKTIPQQLRTLSVMQMVIIGIALLVVGFLILGSIGQANSDELAFGIAAQPFAVLAVLAFAGGLLSFVSPCTLPVLTAYFAFAFQTDRSKIAVNTIVFTLGLATTFSLFGAVGFTFGRVLVRNQELLMMLGGAFILVFGVMNLLGKGFTGMSQMTSERTPTPTLWGSYVFGLTFAIGWSSCVGPILGAVSTLAAQTTSVWRGMMLLFIYTLGLGLPLLIVSTFFGRMSRKSFFWRVLRGKGWDIVVPLLAIGLVWTIAIWRILVPLTVYSFRLGIFAGMEMTTGLQIGLFFLSLVGVGLWLFTGSDERKVQIHLHTTQLFGGAMFIILGIMLLEGQLATLNSVMLQQDWYIAIDEALLEWKYWLVEMFS